MQLLLRTIRHNGLTVAIGKLITFTRHSFIQRTSLRAQAGLGRRVSFGHSSSGIIG